jgi:hypothetical protein
MRTTLTIEPDVAQQIRRRMSQKKLPLKSVVNEALRAGLSSVEKEKKVRFVVEPHSCKLRAGIDMDKLNQLADEMEAEEFLKKMSR